MLFKNDTIIALRTNKQQESFWLAKVINSTVTEGKIQIQWYDRDSKDKREYNLTSSTDFVPVEAIIYTSPKCERRGPVLVLLEDLEPYVGESLQGKPPARPHFRAKSKPASPEVAGVWHARTPTEQQTVLFYPTGVLVQLKGTPPFPAGLATWTAQGDPLQVQITFPFGELRLQLVEEELVGHSIIFSRTEAALPQLPVPLAKAGTHAEAQEAEQADDELETAALVVGTVLAVKPPPDDPEPAWLARIVSFRGSKQMTVAWYYKVGEGKYEYHPEHTSSISTATIVMTDVPLNPVDGPECLLPKGFNFK